MEIPDNLKGRLISQVKAGTVSRRDFLTLFPPEQSYIVNPGGTIRETVEPTDAAIPNDLKPALIKSILRGSVNPDDFPVLWDSGKIVVIFPKEPEN